MLRLTPQARAIAAFTLAVLLLTGDLNRLALALYSVSGADLRSGDGARLVLSLLTVVLAAVVLWLAHTTADAGAPGWETSLAQVARLLAAVGLAIAALATVAVLTNDQPFNVAFSLGG